ncbi:MAG TPA: BON domain-containing protein [Rhodocyclaceae bacterium]|nr:BON domain-containing protein [Zoogloeaceae bacterium]HRD32821.1 BON domain-containing protein [Rhodocyclaceae bacterium]
MSESPVTPSSRMRRRLCIALAASGTLPMLQGCFPLVAGGATAVTLMAADRRTSGIYIEDEGIEWRTRDVIRQRFGNTVNVSVTSFNRNVLLTGEVPNESIRSEAGRLAEGVANVRGVINELALGAPSSLGARSNDTLITSKVRTRFVENRTPGSQHVKVVTEAGTVFLLGIVTRTEADAATQIARTTAGVMKVVRVFEYISDEEAVRLDGLPKAENPPGNTGHN